MTVGPEITTGGIVRVERTSLLYKDAFRDDPVIRYMLSNLSPAARHEYLYSYFVSLLSAAGMNGASFAEADDFGACLVLMHPGRRVDNVWTLIPAGFLGVLWKLGVGGCRRMLGEYEPLTDASKIKGLKGCKGYYYVFFLATREAARGQGLSSALMSKAQETARADGVPLWLEATTEYSWRLYQKLGFETIDVITLGKGRADAEGSQQKGGEGVSVWTMVWWPPKAA